ncbi:MAG TPA: 2TM domain-containing protein [Actinomycetota bacterium]|nr:2TM domain-containing protein [Actinomycetota bacterium]
MPAVGEEERRAQALASLKKKVEFRSHLIAFVLINSVIVVIWAVTGAHFFWPIFPILGWGVGLVLHGVDVYSRGPTEAQIRREMDRLG